MTGAHDALIAGAHAGNKQSFAMHQIIFWVGLIEIITLPAIFEMLNGSPRKPGDFSFDPLGLNKKVRLSSSLSPSLTPVLLLVIVDAHLLLFQADGRMELAEIKNGRLAMIGIGGR